jgi:hypothetical protein
MNMWNNGMMEYWKGRIMVGFGKITDFELA